MRNIPFELVLMVAVIMVVAATSLAPLLPRSKGVSDVDLSPSSPYGTPRVSPADYPHFLLLLKQDQSAVAKAEHKKTPFATAAVESIQSFNGIAAQIPAEVLAKNHLPLEIK